MVEESSLFNVIIMEISTVELKSVHKFSKNVPYIKLFCENYQQITKVELHLSCVTYGNYDSIHSQITTVLKFVSGEV